MNHQQVLLNSSGANASTLQYFVNGHVANAADQLMHQQNVHVQLVKAENNQQRFVKYVQHPQSIPNPQVQIIQQHQHQEASCEVYWLLVEIESSNELNSYALVDSKNVVSQPPLKTLSTGKLVIVNINGTQCRATVVMASGKKFALMLLTLVDNLF